jgi:hypothetical protein
VVTVEDVSLKNMKNIYRVSADAEPIKKWFSSTELKYIEYIGSDTL